MRERPAGPHDPELLATIYLRHHRLHDDADFWAWEEAHDYLLHGEPERAWVVLLALVRQAESEDLEYVGAGLLEDLCQDHGPAFIDRIEAHAANDPKFKDALSNVWLNSLYAPADVVQRLVVASGWAIKPFELDYEKADDADSA